jgi:hypothetical protein
MRLIAASRSSPRAATRAMARVSSSNRYARATLADLAALAVNFHEPGAIENAKVPTLDPYGRSLVVEPRPGLLDAGIQSAQV